MAHKGACTTSVALIIGSEKSESRVQDLDACTLEVVYNAAFVVLLQQVRALQGGEEVWRESKNESGYMPEELWQDGWRAVRQDWKLFWMVE